MAGLFSGCTKLKSVDLSSWDTSSVTSMNGMFGGCSSLTSINLDNWDLSGITYTHAASNDNGFMRTYLGLSSYGDVTDLSFNNVDFGTLDLYCFLSGFSNLINISLNDVDTSGVTSMNDMFGGCTSLTALDLSMFDMHSVTIISKYLFNSLVSFCFSIIICNAKNDFFFNNSSSV